MITKISADEAFEFVMLSAIIVRAITKAGDEGLPRSAIEAGCYISAVCPRLTKRVIIAGLESGAIIDHQGILTTVRERTMQ